MKSVFASNILKDRIALVTGGSRGIGRHISLALAGAGATVAVNYLGNEEAAAEVVSQIQSRNGTASAFKADVSSYEQGQQLIEDVCSQFGRIDIAVNNAGITRDRPLAMMSPTEWNEVICTNLSSSFNICQPLIRSLMRSGWGRIVNIASTGALLSRPGQTNYSAAKAGLLGFTRALSREAARFDITVNAVLPGFIATDMVEQMPEAAQKQYKGVIPLRRFGQPEEVADLVLFLASNAAAYITGSVFVIDGGLTS